MCNYLPKNDGGHLITPRPCRLHRLELCIATIVPLETWRTRNERESQNNLIRSYLQNKPRNTSEIGVYAHANGNRASLEEIEKMLKADSQVVRVDPT